MSSRQAGDEAFHNRDVTLEGPCPPLFQLLALATGRPLYRGGFNVWAQLLPADGVGPWLGFRHKEIKTCPPWISLETAFISPVRDPARAVRSHCTRLERYKKTQ